MGFYKNNEAYVIVTGDTDLAPAIKGFKRIYPNIKIISLFPYKRRNDELKGLVDMHFSLTQYKYVNHQLPNPVTINPTLSINKPTYW